MSRTHDQPIAPGAFYAPRYRLGFAVSLRTFETCTLIILILFILAACGSGGDKNASNRQSKSSVTAAEVHRGLDNFFQVNPPKIRNLSSCPVGTADESLMAYKSVANVDFQLIKKNRVGFISQWDSGGQVRGDEVQCDFSFEIRSKSVFSYMRVQRDHFDRSAVNCVGRKLSGGDLCARFKEGPIAGLGDCTFAWAGPGDRFDLLYVTTLPATSTDSCSRGSQKLMDSVLSKIASYATQPPPRLRRS